MNTITSIKENGLDKFANDLIINLFAAESFKKNSKEIPVVREMIVKR